MTAYANGRHLEYRVRDQLRTHGWKVTRTPGSRGPYDLHATRDTNVALVQVKANARIDREEWNHLFIVALEYGAIPVWAWRDPSNRVHYLRIRSPKPAYQRLKDSSAQVWDPA